MTDFEIDLRSPNYPPDTRIEIKGVGRFAPTHGLPTLLEAVGQVYSILTGKRVIINEDFEKRVKLLKVDVDNKCITFEIDP